MRSIPLAVSALCLIALSASAQTPSASQRRYEGFTTGTNRMLWRLDTFTGLVSACLPTGPGPSIFCTQWGDETTTPALHLPNPVPDLENPFADLIPPPSGRLP